MKRNKLFCLLPIFCLTGCIGANWQVDIKRAKNVANKILSAQNAENFNIRKLSNQFFYENSYFELTDSYDSDGEQVSLISNYYLQSYLIDYKGLTLLLKEREKFTIEGVETSSDDKSNRWIYVKDSVLYDAVDTGKKSGRTYRKFKINLGDHEPNEYFNEYISNVFDLSSIDYKNSSQLDIDFVQRTVDELNVRPDAKSEIKYFSKTEGVLSHCTESEYSSYHEEPSAFFPNGCYKTGKEKITYEWSNNIYSGKEINSMFEYVFDGQTMKTTINETYRCEINANNGSLTETDPKYKKDYVFSYPKLSEFTLIE